MPSLRNDKRWLDEWSAKANDSCHIKLKEASGFQEGSQFNTAMKSVSSPIWPVTPQCVVCLGIHLDAQCCSFHWGHLQPFQKNPDLTGSSEGKRAKADLTMGEVDELSRFQWSRHRERKHVIIPTWTFLQHSKHSWLQPMRIPLWNTEFGSQDSNDACYPCFIKSHYNMLSGG